MVAAPEEAIPNSEEVLLGCWVQVQQSNIVEKLGHLRWLIHHIHLKKGYSLLVPTAPPLTLTSPQVQYTEVLLPKLTEEIDSLITKGAVEVMMQDVPAPEFYSQMF